MKTIVVTNQKGGVGKTTVSFNLIKELGRKGFKVLGIDNDPQANLTFSLLEGEPDSRANVLNLFQEEDVVPQRITDNIDLLYADIHLAKVAESDFDVIFRIREQLEKIQGYDFVVIDCLPAFGYLNMAALNAAQYALIPTKPAPYALAGLSDLLDSIEKTKKRLNPQLNVIGVLLNLTDSTILSQDFEELIREDTGCYVFDAVLRRSVKFEESPTSQQSVAEYDSKSNSAKQFNAFLNEFLNRFED